MKEITTLLPCPCCGSKNLSELGEYEICEVCGWEDDPSQSADPDLDGGANELSLHEAQAIWQKKEKARANSIKKPPNPKRTNGIKGGAPSVKKKRSS